MRRLGMGTTIVIFLLLPGCLENQRGADEIPENIKPEAQAKTAQQLQEEAEQARLRDYLYNGSGKDDDPIANPPPDYKNGTKTVPHCAWIQPIFGGPFECTAKKLESDPWCLVRYYPARNGAENPNHWNATTNTCVYRDLQGAGRGIQFYFPEPIATGRIEIGEQEFEFPVTEEEWSREIGRPIRVFQYDKWGLQQVHTYGATRETTAHNFNFIGELPYFISIVETTPVMGVNRYQFDTNFTYLSLVGKAFYFETFNITDLVQQHEISLTLPMGQSYAELEFEMAEHVFWSPWANLDSTEIGQFRASVYDSEGQRQYTEYQNFTENRLSQRGWSPVPGTWKIQIEADIPNLIPITSVFNYTLDSLDMNNYPELGFEWVYSPTWEPKSKYQ